MTDRFNIDMQGIDAYLKKLTDASENVDESAINAVLAGGEVAKDGMQMRVAKDTHNLEKHIVVGEVKRDGNFTSVDVGVLHADEETSRYGNAQEYGTSSMPAQPYIRPTQKEDAGKIKKTMKESLIEDGVL